MAQYGVGPATLFVALWILYFALSPHAHFQRLFHAPGAIIALVVWLMMGAAFSYYLNYANQFFWAYGSLGGVLIAQIFFYAVAVGFILGAEFNACWARHFHDDMEALAANHQRREKDTASAQEPDKMAPTC